MCQCVLVLPIYYNIAYTPGPGHQDSASRQLLRGTPKIYACIVLTPELIFTLTRTVLPTMAALPFTPAVPTEPNNLVTTRNLHLIVL